MPARSRSLRDPAYALPDQQRAALAEIRSVDADYARAYARRVRARYTLSQRWEQAAGGRDDVVLELAGTGKIGQTRATTELGDARRLVEVLRGTLRLLEEGAVFVPTVELLLSLTRRCTDEVAAEVERRVLDRLAADNTTDLRRLLREVVLQVEVDLDPELVREREQRARDDRNVWVAPGEDGMAQIGATVDQLVGQRWCLDFEELVRAQAAYDQAHGVQRTRNQRRSDVFAALPGRLLALLRAQTDQQGDADLALGTVLQGLRARDARTIVVHVPVTTLIDTDHRCGWIDGLGPVTPHRARLLLPAAGLRRLLVDADTGTPLHLDPKTLPPLELFDPVHGDADLDQALAEKIRERMLSLLEPAAVREDALAGHDPTRALTEFLELRDQTCAGPGCSMPARACDSDHETPWPEGPTASWNLSSKSRRCHRAKHHAWGSERDLDTQRHVWQSPLGHVYQRPGVWQAAAPMPYDTELPGPRLVRDQPGPYFDDSTWNQPLHLPDPPAAPERPAGSTPERPTPAPGDPPF